jgi:hypothetical protein
MSGYTLPTTKKMQKFLMTKNLPPNDFRKASQAADFQQETRPGRNSVFSATPLCPIFTRISTQPGHSQTRAWEEAVAYGFICEGDGAW